MLTLVKLGGSLITDKHVEKSFRRDVMKRLADEIAYAMDQVPTMQLLVGHGSGSFGHFAAKKLSKVTGVRSRDDWYTFANVSMVASELNYMVCDCLQSSGIPVWRFQPSASLVCDNGRVLEMSVEGIGIALQAGIVPVVYGDVSVDRTLGGVIISTERLFFYLSSVLSVSRIFLLGEVDGVYGEDGKIIPMISRENYSSFSKVIAGSSGVDVTGGMETKVSEMLETASGSMTIRIFNGLKSNLLRDALVEKALPGTLIVSR